VVIHGDARDHVGLFARQLGKALGDEANRLAHGDLHGFLEVRVEAHHDPMGRGFGARPCELQVLAHDELEPAAQPGLDGREIDFALALGGMGVADREQRTGCIDRHEQRGAGRHVLVVDVAGVDAGRSRTDAAHGGCRSNAHGAEEGAVERDHHAGRDLGLPGSAVDFDEALEYTGELLRQCAGVRALAVVAIVDGKIDREDAHLQHVAGFGAVDGNRTGEHMRSWAAILDVTVDGADVVGHGGRRHHAGPVDLLRLHRSGSLDGDDVAGFDRQRRLRSRAEMADTHSLRTGHQRVFGGVRG
jgi:hypothetical protein